MKPDTPKTTFTMLLEEKTKTPPRIIFGTTALKWIAAIVEVHPLEVGFYGIVDEREDYTFYVRDIFYPKHSEANGATCEISPEGETDMIEWLCSNGREDDVSKVRLWGHSHHNMTTGPSTQDENQAIERMQATQSFLIRVICIKKGEMALSFFDYDNKVRFDHVKWEVEKDAEDPQNSHKLVQISEIISSTEKSLTEKITEINQVTVRDYHSEIIKNKVEELKEINIPKDNVKSSVGYFRKNRGGKNQTNIFTSEGGYHYDDDLETQYQASIDKDDQFDSTEVERMLMNYENNISIEGG